MTIKSDDPSSIKPGGIGWNVEQRVFDGVFHTQTEFGLLPVRCIDHPLVAKVERLQLSRSDFESVVLALEHILTLPDEGPNTPSETVIDVLFQGAVICYCRAFQGEKLHALKAPDVYGHSTAELNFHERIWALRSKHYAHDVNGFRDAGVGLCVSPDGKRFTIASGKFRLMPPPELLRVFLTLAHRAFEFCQKQIDEVGDILMRYVDLIGPHKTMLAPYLGLDAPDFEDVLVDRRGKGRKPFRPVKE